MQTLPELFDAGVARPRERHLLWRTAAGTWEALSTDEVRRQVDLVARALAARGLAKGDRVALLARNHPRWALADHAMQRAGLVNVPLYPTLAPDQVRFILADCGARLLLVEDAAQHERLRACLPGTGVESVVLVTGESPSGVPAGTPSDAGPGGGGATWEALLAEGEAAPDPGVGVAPGDLASIIYTSGTTGRPKGAMLTQWNLVSNALACAEAIDLTREEHVNLSLLPLCHVFQRLVDYLLFMTGATMAYCPSPLEALEYFGEVRPTFFASVPRLFEKVRTGFDAKVAAAPAWRRALAGWALETGRRRFDAWYRDGACDGRVSAGLALTHAVADRLVLSKVRALFGGRASLCFSGGAPLPSDVHAFYRSIGMGLLPGYGLTEASPVLSTNRQERMKLGSVGPALPGVELRTAEDGELLARGPNVMAGYWNLPEETAEAIRDGWLHTGDLARIDERGYVFITGRKKEILVLSTGKKVSPQLVEDRLSRSPLVSQVVLIGDGEKHVAALVAPDFERLGAACREAGIEVESSPEALAGSREAVRLVLDDLLACCEGLSDYEKPKRVALLPRELSQAEGELTPTLKVRRAQVLERHRELVAGLYPSGGGSK